HAAEVQRPAGDPLQPIQDMGGAVAQVVGDDQLMSARGELDAGMAADVAGTAEDEDAHATGPGNASGRLSVTMAPRARWPHAAAIPVLPCRAPCASGQHRPCLECAPSLTRRPDR